MVTRSLDCENEESPRSSKLLLLKSGFSMDLKELDCFMPCDTDLLIQDFDWVLGVRLVSLERCHFRQHDIHGCLQAFLQLRHVEDVVISS
jgi:hypothetical protein